MADPVLIVTSAPGLGEVVRRTLVESGRYEVVLTTNAPQAVQLARAFPFSIAILDIDLDRDFSGASLKKLGVSLREINPQIHIIALSASSDPFDPDIKMLAPEGMITTPLYPGSILRTVDRVAGMTPANLASLGPLPEASNPTDEEQPEDKHPAWLQDVSRAAQHLTRLSLETASQAALIVSEERLWAYAGELPQPAAQELAEIVVHYWGRNGESDLARFVQLDSDGGEYLLYATALGSGMVLALVFGVETPFSKIRSQVVKLARLLSSPPPAEKTVASAGENAPRLQPGQSKQMLDSTDEGIIDRPLYKDIPPPSPKTRQDIAVQPGWEKTRNERGDAYPDSDFHSVKKGALSYQSPGVGNPEIEKTTGTGPMPSALGIAPADKFTDLEGWGLAPASTGVYSLTYGILLVPRLPNHHLIGDLAERLPLWVSQLCVAFDWRLEHISVRPDYLQWNASAAPEIPPAQIVRNMRKHTSQRIFDEFPVLGRENPSGDFWATGFLLVTGSQPPSGKLVQEFIQQTRVRQGITKPVSRQNR